MQIPFPIEKFPSPCFVLDDAALRRNVALLNTVQERTGAKILLALKGFALWDAFPLVSRAFKEEGGSGALYGCCASSPHEARLARTRFGGEVHAFAAAFSDEDMDDLLQIADHIVFNSFAQAKRFIPKIHEYVQQTGRHIDIGLRLNPEHSEGAVDIYNPCAKGSRLGVRHKDFDADFAKEHFDGLHMHTLCQQGAEALIRTVDALERSFGDILPNMSWLNLGGGHHITRKDYDIDALCALLIRLRNSYGVQVYLEPGEAVGLNAGWLVATVLDIVQADMPIAILDTSASAHMPDVLEMPYRPDIIGSGLPLEKAHSYRLAGKSCLAGDVIGEYSFDAPLEIGDRLAFTDMAIYSMVKTTTFNGLALPSIARWDADTQNIKIVRTFGYEDFEGRLS